MRIYMKLSAWYRRHTEEVFVCLIMLLFVLFSLPVFTACFRSDSEIYYNGICQNADKIRNGEFSLNNLGIAGHSCYGYSIFVFIGQLLLPDYGIGVRLVNLCMALFTIALFGRLLCKCFPMTEKWTRLFLTAAFAFSPFLLGIFGEVHTDFPVLCFFIWLVYFYVSGRQKLTLFTGFLLCFSKETGILYYCAFFGSCFLYRLVKNKNKSWLKKLFDEFSICEWFLLIPADMFLVCAATSKGWTGSAINPVVTEGVANTFSFSWDYILLKLDEIFLMNFAWLLIIPLALFVVALFRKKISHIEVNVEWFIGFSFTGIVFLVFNCSYYTYTHYRYLMLYLPLFLLLVLYLLEKSTKNVWIKRSVSMIFAGAFLLESFVTADPVTYLAFRNIDTGNGKIVTTSVFAVDSENKQSFINISGEEVTRRTDFLDAIVYNRDYLGFERVMEEALQDIDYEESKGILFPAIYDESMFSTIFALLGTHAPWELYWDSDTGNITLNQSKERINWTDISKELPENIGDYEELWYVKIPYQGEMYEEKNLKYFEIMEERTYTAGKWKIILERVRLSK